jgi:hypothetical protein
MKIKDISKFRTYWKEKEGFQGFDENFIGTNHNGVNGFYRIVNGTVHDIKADLTPKLQNAQDEQAIYEFLQNAADSNSSNCAVIYDEDYFMVINNGLPFTVKDVEAILNSFQGTKADKSQKQNCDKIGRYGIGFKLVHRLVGKSDGAKELIENLDGPVIFSWFDKKQFNDFTNEPIGQTFSYDEELTKENSPWLFKISLTCFPTMPNESVKGLDYDETVIYSNEELGSINFFLSKHKTRIDKLNLDKGSLFFLKFGQNKHKKLEESLKNINSGIGYSLNTLKTLETVILQEQIVTRIPIERIDIKIFPDDEAFKNIDPEFPECPIELMFGYKSDEYETLRSAPNIYQFFPMRNESHGLSFLIHASSFAKVTDRTKLDDQGESNIYTFQFLSEKIKELLSEDYQVNNKEKARDIFKSIIFSEISQRQNSQLVVNEFLLPLIEYFKENVPSKNDDFLSNTAVLIKGTELEINPIDFGIDKQWFYWNIDNDKELIKEARKSEKLQIEKWDLENLIEKCNINSANKYILNLYNETQDNYSVLLKEINEISETSWKNNNSKLFKIFNDLILFPYFDKTGNEFIVSLNYCLSNNIVILQRNQVGIRDTLIKLDIKVSTQSVDRDLSHIDRMLCEKINYIKTEINLYKFIVAQTEKNADKLSIIEKKELFLFLKSLIGVGPKLIMDLLLFQNNSNEIKPLGELITTTIKVEPWISKYQIAKEEYFKELDDYLVQQEAVYPLIIFPKWYEIIDDNEFDESSIENLYSTVIKYYDDETHRGKSLTKQRYVFSENEFFENGEIFYNETFQSINDYLNLASVIQKVTEYKTPNLKTLKFLSQAPFKTENDKLLDHLNDVELETKEVYELLRYCQKTETKIFTKATFSESVNKINISTDVGKMQYFSTDHDLIEFIKEHLSDTFVLLPKSIEDYKTLEGVLRNQELFEKIISEVDNIYELAETFLPLLNHKEVIKLYISGLDELRLKSNNDITKDSFEYLIISNIVQRFDEEEFEEIKNKLIIEDDEIEFKLSEITSRNDIQFDYNDKIYTLKVSEILPDSDNFAKTEILETLISKLKKLELPKTKTEILFSFVIEDDDLIEKIASDLNETIEKNTLINSQQVAFALLYEAKNGWSNFDDFQIYASNETAYSLKEVWYVKNYSFLNEIAAISEKYEGLGKVLKLKVENPIFKISDECIFLFKPTFDDEGNFLCKYLDEELDNEKCVEFFDFIFDEYNKRGKDSKRDFEAITDWSILGDTETKKIIGLIPNETILIEDTDYILETEQAPDWLIQWADTKQKLTFFNVLGIHQEDSDIIKLRQSLFDVQLITSEEISNSETINNQILENTLRWLCEADIWEDKCIEDVEKVKLLNSIISKLDLDEDDYWSIAIGKLSEESEEWNDANYNNWRDNEDSFDVYLFKGQMPHEFKYKNLIIAIKGSGDYWFDKDENIFYCDVNKSTLLLLQMAAEEGVIECDSIKPLTNQGLARVKELEEENRKLRSQVAKSKGKLETDYNEDDIPTSDDLLDNTDDRTRIGIIEEAQQQIFSLLKSKGFKFPSDINILYTVVDGIIKPNGTRIKIVTKSAKGGTIYFNPSEWLALSEDESQLFVVLSGQRVYNVTLDDLIQNNDKFHLRFNTQAFAVKANLKAFAQMVKYLPETHFLFNAPISTTDFLKEFGLNERNQSSSELSADDKNLLH